MRVRVLGELEVERAGSPVDLGGPKPRALFALLVAGDGHPVSVERLVDQVWESAPPARVEASLQSYVARLRRALGSGATSLRTHAGGYSLDLSGAEVDARRFADLVDRARAEAPTAAAARLREALALWRGPAYAAFTAPILQAEAVRLDELRLAATGDLWGLRLALGEHRAAVPELEQLVRLHPLHERFWALLARALYAEARQGDALAALRRARERLADDLGVDPGAELLELERAILQQDPSLVPAAPPQVAVTVAAEPRGGGPEPQLLAGRSEPLRRAEEVIDAASRAGTGRVILIGGEAGIGKSRLAQELIGRARAAGLRTGWGGWEVAPSPALWAWSTALDQATGQPLDLETAGNDAAAASFRQAQRVLELLAGAPTLLVLDDVQWADAESLRLLARVAWGLRSVPAVLVVTLRTPSETSAEVANALGTLARADPLRLELAGLDPAEVARCVAAQSGREISAVAAEELTRRTDGNPLYLVEMVRYLIAAGALDDPGDPAWARVPGGVHDTVRHRLSDLPRAWTTVLGTAATIGREFNLALVERVHGDSDEVAAAVEAAKMRGLVEESGPGRARFSHALVRDALYESVPARARRHAAVAHAGEELYAGRIAEHAGDLADHYRLAGPPHARAAWLLAEVAAARAAERSGHDEAAHWFDTARRLQLDDPLATDRESERVLRALARERVRRGHPVAAWEPAAAAARSALAGDRPEDAADALSTVTEGLVWGWREAATWDDEAIEVWRCVLDANPEATIARARLTAALAMEHLYRPGSTAEGTRLADEAVALARGLDVGGETLGVLQMAHTALLRPELVHHRGSLAEEVVALATAQRNEHVLAGALCARAQDRAELGRWQEARTDVARALEIAEREGLPQALIVAGWCESTILLAAGDEAGAERRIAAGQRLQDRLEDASQGIDLGHLGMLRDAQGRLAELEPVLAPLRHHHPALRELHALALARTGDLDRLRVVLGSWADQPPIIRDYSWLFLTAVRAETWALLGDRDAADDLYVQLTPYADRLAVTLAIGLRGAVAHWLGVLAGVRRDRDAARDHLRAALRTHRALGMELWARRAEAALNSGSPAG